jgi:hypothetical protein
VDRGGDRAGERRAITSFGDLERPRGAGLVQSFEGSTGVENGLVADCGRRGSSSTAPSSRSPGERNPEEDDDDSTPFRP